MKVHDREDDVRQGFGLVFGATLVSVRVFFPFPLILSPLVSCSYFWLNSTALFYNAKLQFFF